MNAREHILGKLRASAPATPLPEPAISSSATGTSHDKAQLATELARRLRAMRAEVIETTTSTWPSDLARVLQDKGVNRILFDPAAPSTKEAVSALVGSVSPVMFDQPIEAWKQELFTNIDAGFTEASGAIAGLGALLMHAGPNEPRTLSLVPPIHIVLIRARRLFPDMLTAARSQGWAANMPTNLVMVSGPSKTSDIQQTLAFGAHGPRDMVVLLAHEELEHE